MKKVLHILPLFLLLLSCGKMEKLPTDVTSFTFEIKKVTGTKVWFDITSDNPNAYYTFGIVDRSAEGYDMSANEMAELQLALMDAIFMAFSPLGENMGSFSDVFLYQGNRELRELNLDADKEYKLFLMQVDPETHRLIGDAMVEVFRTKAIETVDMDFELVFHPDAVEVIPSSDQHTYYWTYEETATIEEHYYDPEYFYYNLVDMYEEYEFMNHLLDKGPTEWVFSREDKGIVEGRLYTLVVAGYEKGEINTGYTIVNFIYHKDTPIEIVDYDWEPSWDDYDF